MDILQGGSRPLYDPHAVQPMRDELTQVGFRELRTPEDVDAVLGEGGTALLMVNSVCGCAAGAARPGVSFALQHKVIPDQLTTVFAGNDREATEKARSYLSDYPPSSPCIALFKDGKVVAILQRQDIEVRDPQQVAAELVALFDTHCTREGPSIPREEFEKLSSGKFCGSSIPRFEGR